jgi:DNA-directed RNA polymerase subunit N (RpoN/RPB10)
MASEQEGRAMAKVRAGDYCASCGAEIGASWWHFCGYCGKRLTLRGAPQTAKQHVDELMKSGRARHTCREGLRNCGPLMAVRLAPTER